MGKPTICICENKGADQLRGNREADQRLCFRYTDSEIPLPSKSKISSLSPSSVLVQAGLCLACSETTLLVFPRDGSNTIEYVQELIQLNSKFSNTSTQSERKEALTCIQKHYENLPMQYTEIFLALKIENFQLKKFVIFSYFCSKHKFWVHVRTASPRRF